MTGIACFVLGRLPPDIMRGSKFPRGEHVKVFQTALYIKLKGVLVHRDMTHRDKTLRSFLGFQGVQTDLELHDRRLVFIELKAFFIFSKMTAIAVFISLGMTNVTTHLIFVYPVVFNIFRFCIINFIMAVQTFWAVFNIITVSIILAVPVHLISLVTLVAFKVFLFMDIRFKTFIFTKIFFSNPAPVTGRTDLLHWRLSLEQVPIQ